MKMALNRRRFLKYSLMTGLSLPAGFALAGKKTAVPHKTGRIIDVHHHIIPGIYKRSLEKIGITTTNRAPFPAWDPQKSIDAMDRNGIRTAITSISSPGVFFGDTGFAVDLARRCNEFSAGLIRRHPTRFGGFAVLPLPDTDAALRELAYALDVLKLDGVVLLSNVGGTYLGAPEFDGLFQELDRRRAVVYVHPTEPADGMFPKMRLPPAFFEFLFDTTRAVATLIQRDIPGRFPNIRFIIAHAGGTAPYLAWKMSLTARMSGSNGDRAVSQLKGLYYDTALSTSRYTLGLLSELAGPDRIVFGSDFPFAPEFITASCIYELNHHSSMTPGVLKQVYAGNAAGLFPRFNG